MEPLESQHLGDELKKKKLQRNLKTTLGNTKIMEGGLARAAYWEQTCQEVSVTGTGIHKNNSFL